jgi:phospholipase C
LGCGLHPVAARAAAVPRLNHIIVVIMENHSYDEVRSLPYTASLVAAGSSCANSRGVTHPSEPNYLALWAASTLGVTNDACPPPGSPYVVENLGHACETAGLTWRAYSEDLPSAGWSGCAYAGYARKHAPWTSFGNLTHAYELSLTELAADEAANTLPNLAFVVPNMCHDTHDCSLATGDAWLAANIPAMLQAVGPRGIVILTYDEDDRTTRWCAPSATRWA